MARRTGSPRADRVAAGDGERPVHRRPFRAGVGQGRTRGAHPVPLRPGLPGDLPDYIVANVTNLKIGNKMYVTEVASDKYTIQHPENTVICQVKTSRNIIEDLPEDEEEVPADAVPATETDDVAAVKEE